MTGIDLPAPHDLRDASDRNVADMNGADSDKAERLVSSLNESKVAKNLNNLDNTPRKSVWTDHGKVAHLVKHTFNTIIPLICSQ